jgi:hypothetical protein
MKKKLVIRKPKQLVIRRPKKMTRIICGPFKNRVVCLLKNGFSGWHCRFDDTGELGYVFRNEVQ